MLEMTEKRSTSGKPKGSGKPNRTGKATQIWLRPDLRALLEALAERNRRTMTAEIELALEKHFRDEGLIPDSAPGTPA